MATESKKLQTRMDGPYLLGTNDAGLYAAYEHDARIAHDQRKVIRKAVEAMGAILQPGGCDWQALRDALAAAAPYILED